jgi:glyoxylase-like metal-dependent hydrolase (beta-lactamase superfamily II)
MDVIAQHDPDTGTITYILADPATRACAVIDSVLDYEPKAARTSTLSAAKVAAAIEARGLTCQWLLETHVHADHLSAAAWLQRRIGGRIGIGSRIAPVQALFAEVFGLEKDFPTDGRQFDVLFEDGAEFAVGGIVVQVLHTPGHTPACVTYVAGDAAFVGDTLFMPDAGTARCDFPGGDAGQLYRSIRRILALPEATRVFTAHDYGPGGRAPAWESTVTAQRALNIHMRDGVAEPAFVATRQARDATLAMPTLILPSVQVNIRAGQLPDADAQGRRFLQIPLDRM